MTDPPSAPPAWPDRWLSEDPLPSEPFPILANWLTEAFEDGRQPSPHAVALATVDAAGDPAVRMVLVQAIEADAGALVFHSHRDSPKGRELAAHPRASAAFHFSALGRQARVSGPVGHVADVESDAYFATRPVDSQIGAWVSRQSEPLESRAALVAAMERRAAAFGVDLAAPGPSPAIPRPRGWGGFRLRADRIELWHSRPGRVHDRAVWQRTGSGWTSQRLQP